VGDALLGLADRKIAAPKRTVEPPFRRQGSAHWQPKCTNPGDRHERLAETRLIP
jgi:hypothetical protein